MMKAARIHGYAAEPVMEVSNPYHVNVGGGTYALQIGAGGGQTTGTSDASAVLTVVRNPNAFEKGLVFGAGSLTGTDGSAGDTGFGAALSIARNQGFEWWTPDGAAAAILRSTVTQRGLGSRLEFQDSGVEFLNANGQALFSVGHSGGVLPYNTLQVQAGTALASSAGLYATPAAGGNGNIALHPAPGGVVEIWSNLSAPAAAAATPAFGYLHISINSIDARIALYSPAQAGG